ncbi:uncharacterized protein [Penaeus vannamei]|uniref:uncharacterized protein n=1 Tax=Penaeus vannamei TaxID=6689 RepID=UPI00387F4526
MTGLYRSFAPSHYRTKINAASWTTLRRRTLTHLHDSHRGVEATRRRASTVEACDSCQRLQPSQQQEPYLCDDQPSRPFESVSADFFQEAGNSFLVIADRLSGWPVVTPCCQDTTATKVMRMFCRYFREIGVSVRLRTDGGPPFTIEWPRRGCSQVREAFDPQDGDIDCEAFDRGLLELRNTPTPAGRFPAQILYGHPLRTCVPAHPQSFSAEWRTKSDDWDRNADQVTSLYDSHARPLPSLSVGQRVRIQDHKSIRWDKVGVVMGCGRSRQYEVRLPSGHVWWRNCRHLRPVPVPKCEPSFLSPVSPCQDQETGSLHVPPVTPRRSPRLVAKSPVSARDATTSAPTPSANQRARQLSPRRLQVAFVLSCTCPLYFGCMAITGRKYEEYMYED